MNAVKKRKLQKFIQKYKALILGIGIFLVIGIIGMFIGFEIQQDWHAVRNWLASPYATTFFVVIFVGLFVIGIIVMVLINIRRGDE